MERRNFLISAAAVTGAVAMPGIALAQWRPRRPVTLIVPFPTGGGTDAYGRAVALGLRERLGVPVNVVNKPGGGGVNGAAELARARADGLTLMVTTGGALVMGGMFKSIPVDLFDDLTTLGQAGSLQAAVAVPFDSPYQTLGDLFDAVRAAPDSLRWAHTGRGAFLHVAGQSLLDANALSAVDVPFAGGGKVRAAVLGSQVDFAVIGIHQAVGFEQQMRVLGLIAPQRYALQADVPTVAEFGYEYSFVDTPITLHGPKDLPDETAQVLTTALQETVSSPQFAKDVAAQGLLPAYLDGHAAVARLSELQDAVAPVIQALK
ncbi:tripartite tricarboxylate transporter substrate binding protein [Paracoccus sp. Z330]|uniref:Tripartite tricarboxylate transporter substrate binding protein n=1 Tax=Paracoccus onchidii TaxID=3017813 RepID=A0ABT4ZJI0_9RHOB|nr:tripartite tricarboxylate transporter substrate binding protein [Paracoccus onchidii]MDB6179510.1 tripartite tricarboxylate transporter substrate binding protein [Paracoccus onchidii]